MKFQRSASTQLVPSRGLRYAVISPRCLMVEAPQAGLRHRVRPALVAPFLMKQVAHTPQKGRLVGRDIE